MVTKREGLCQVRGSGNSEGPGWKLLVIFVRLFAHLALRNRQMRLKTGKATVSILKQRRPQNGSLVINENQEIFGALIIDIVKGQAVTLVAHGHRVAGLSRGTEKPLAEWVSTCKIVRSGASVRLRNKTRGGRKMQKMRYVFWQDKDMWLGYLEQYPDSMTQGASEKELKENLKDIYEELISGTIPCVRRGS